MIQKNKQAGVTIIEIMLVLIIGAFLLMMGIRMYLSFSRDKDAELLKNNVNTLFQGLANFYRANCIQYKTSASIQKEGVLDPAASPSPLPGPLAINISAQLKTPGFLAQWPFPPNPFVKTTGPGQGYVVQFNLLQTTRYADQASTQPVGTIYLWKAQVAIQVSDASKAQAYQKLLGGDCLSSYAAGVVQPCSAGITGDYIVWERLPSFASPEASSLWVMMPTLNQFTQMYTTYPILIIRQGSVTQSYLCGG